MQYFFLFFPFYDLLKWDTLESDPVTGIKKNSNIYIEIGNLLAEWSSYRHRYITETVSNTVQSTLWWV